MDDDLRRYADLIATVRRVLEPAWSDIHRSDIVWGRSRAMPPVLSHAMCRHAASYLRRVALDADRRSAVRPRSAGSLSSAWRVVQGELDPSLLPTVPSYVQEDACHFAVMDPVGRIIDPTADQFGLDPLAPRHHSAIFRKAPEASDPGLAASARRWAAHPEHRVAVDIASALSRAMRGDHGPAA